LARTKTKHGRKTRMNSLGQLFNRERPIACWKRLVNSFNSLRLCSPVSMLLS